MLQDDEKNSYHFFILCYSYRKFCKIQIMSRFTMDIRSLLLCCLISSFLYSAGNTGPAFTSGSYHNKAAGRYAWMHYKPKFQHVRQHAQTFVCEYATPRNLRTMPKLFALGFAAWWALNVLEARQHKRTLALVENVLSTSSLFDSYAEMGNHATIAVKPAGHRGVAITVQRK